MSFVELDECLSAFRVRLVTYLDTSVSGLRRVSRAMRAYQIRDAIAIVTTMFVAMDITNIAVPQSTMVSGTGFGRNHCDMEP